MNYHFPDEPVYVTSKIFDVMERAAEANRTVADYRDMMKIMYPMFRTYELDVLSVVYSNYRSQYQLVLARKEMIAEYSQDNHLSPFFREMVEHLA